MKQRLVYLLSIIFTIIVIVLWILLLNRTVFAKSEPIQEILDQIKLNESELQQIETRTDELNKANEEAKEKLLNEYWLQISESKVEEIDSCKRPYEIAFERLADWIDTDVAHNVEVLENQWCIEEAEDIKERFKDYRTPWKLNASWDAQEMPEIKATDEHERFKELAQSYWLDASQIRAVENHYWIKEWVILCITVAETSWWNRWAWWKNIWSVWSNDRWDRPTYALMESWLEDIGKTLNNRYLWKIQTLWCLSNAWSCQSRDDNWKRYATSDWNRQRNMVACLSSIYWKVNASEFRIRR